MADPTQYRENTEVDEARLNDPIERLKNDILLEDIMTEDEFTSIDEEIETLMEDATIFADESPLPDLSVIDENIYQ